MSEIAPEWFRAAVAAPVENGETQVDGCTVRFRAWGPVASEGVVLVHGGAAHSRWWDHIGPLLASDRRVVALDLSGHGDSDRREAYDLDTWSEEIVAVAAAAGLRAPVVIGHSMGGMVTLVAAQRFGADLGGVMVIDTPIREVTPEEYAARHRIAFGPLRTYATRDDAVRHFRLVPEQSRVLQFVAERIAETSVRERGDGWTWKFDPRVFARTGLAPDALQPPACRVALFYCERGITTGPMQDMVLDRLGRAAVRVEIPNAQHHAMVDEPLALVTGIRTVLALWGSTAAGGREQS